MVASPRAEKTGYSLSAPLTHIDAVRGRREDFDCRDRKGAGGRSALTAGPMVGSVAPEELDRGAEGGARAPVRASLTPLAPNSYAGRPAARALCPKSGPESGSAPPDEAVTASVGAERHG